MERSSVDFFFSVLRVPFMTRIVHEMAKFKNKWSCPFAESLLECERQLQFMQYR